MLDEVDRLAPEDMVARVADARGAAPSLRGRAGRHARRVDRRAAGPCRARPGARRHRAADRRPSRPARRRFRLQRARPQPVRAFLRDAPRLRDGLSDLLGRHSGVRARRVPVRRRSWPAGVRVGQGRRARDRGDPRRDHDRARLPHGRRRRLRSGGGAGHRHARAGRPLLGVRHEAGARAVPHQGRDRRRHRRGGAGCRARASPNTPRRSCATTCCATSCSSGTASSRFSEPRPAGRPPEIRTIGPSRSARHDR